MKVHLITVFACIVFPWSTPCSAQDRASELSTIAHRAWDSVENLRVSFSFDALEAPANSPHYRYSAEVVRHGENILIDSTYGPDLAFRNTTFRREVSYNGARTTTLEMHEGFARVADGKSREASTNGLGFFDLAMCNLPQQGGNGLDDVSLLALLDAPQAQVRSEKEAVNGVDCDVVDFVLDGRRLLTAWVDADRGCLPLRWVLRPRTGEDRALLEFEVQEVTEAAPGLWLPIRGTKRVHAQGTGRPTDMNLLFQMEVQRDNHDQLLLKVNAPLDDAVFNLWEHVPGGTEVWDVDLDTRWIASGSSYFDPLLVLYAALDLNGCPIAPGQADPSSLTARLLGAMSPIGLSEQVDPILKKGDLVQKSPGRAACGPAALAVCLDLV